MKIHNNTKVIYGPPGTGKTTTLINLTELLLAKTSPQRIIFTSYTRTGAYVARERAVEAFNYHPREFKWFSTLHGICFRLLGHPDVMRGKHKLEFGRSIGTSFTFTDHNDELTAVQQTRGDKLLHVHEMSIKTGKKLEDCRLEYAPEIPPNILTHFSKSYTDYKKANNVIDFTDMLADCLDLHSGDMPDVDYLIVDEAQDLFLLQWKVIEKLATRVKEVIIAGDDDQCIHAWSGSAPEYLINVEAKKQVLPQSYRIPDKIHQLANKIICKIKNREPKVYKPTNKSGTINYVNDLNKIPLEIIKNGSWLLLARNRKFIERYTTTCYKKCVIYKVVGSDETVTLGSAIHIWKKLKDGESIPGSQAKLLYSFLKARDRVKYGYKKVIEASLQDEQLVDFNDLRDKFGLLYGGEWRGAFFHRSSFELDYFSKVESSYGFLEEPLIRISTIHASKGDEADNIVIMPDMSYKTYQGYIKDPDNEHRVFYVGVTRTKKNLYICKPLNNMHYDF